MEESKKHILEIASLAEVTCERFSGIFTAFSKCHNGYNENVLTNDAIEQIGKRQTCLKITFKPVLQSSI